MNTRLPFLAILLFVVSVGCATAQAPPPALQDLVQAEWQTETESLTLWTTPDADSAYVVGDTQTLFRAHLSSGETWVHCPETVGPPFPLTAIADSAEVMLRERKEYGINSATMLRAECTTTIASIEDSVRNAQ